MRLDIPESVTEFAKKIPFFAEKQEVAVFELSDVISLNNRNYRVDADGESYLLRIANDFGKFLGIRRENETESARAAAEAGLGPEIFHSDASGTMVMEFIHGKHWSPEAFHDPVNLERLGTALSKLHAIKTVRADGSQFRTIERLLESARSLGVRLPPEIKEYQAKAERIEKMRLEVSQYSPGLKA